MNKRSKFVLLGFSVIILIYVVLYNKTQKYIYYCSFNGKIESIEYDAKRQPTVVINGEAFSFSFGRDEIKENDSLVKKDRSTLVKHYRSGKLLNEFDW